MANFHSSHLSASIPILADIFLLVRRLTANGHGRLQAWGADLSGNGQGRPLVGGGCGTQTKSVSQISHEDKIFVEHEHVHTSDF